MFFYSTVRISVITQNETGASNFDPLRCNATKCYIGHYENYLALDHISKYGDMSERHQANKELEICKRKMAYWKRQPHFNTAEAMRQRERLNRRS